MHWNYRVWRVEDYGTDLYEIRETFYNDAGEITACTEEAIGVYSDTIDGVEAQLEMMCKAIEKDALVLDGFKFAEGGW